MNRSMVSELMLSIKMKNPGKLETVFENVVDRDKKLILEVLE